MEVASDRRWSFPVAPGVLWDRIARTDEYRGWWPWLRRFEAEGLVEGAVWRCVVQPPLPYVLRFEVELVAVAPGASVDAVVRGDIRGRARLTVDADADARADGDPGRGASVVRLVSSLEPANAVLRAVGVIAAPVVAWGHDWVLDQGQRQFRRDALP